MVDEKTGEVKEGHPRPFYVGGKNVARKITHPDCGPGITKQEFRREADINTIMEKYKVTGLLPQQVAQVQGHFANFANVDDYYTACSKAADAQSAFNALPSRLRKIFDNDPGKLVAFVSNPKNKLAAAKMGLLTPEGTRKAYEEALAAKQAAEDKIVAASDAKRSATKAASSKKPSEEG